MNFEDLDNAHKEIEIQKIDKEARAAELLLANIELDYQSSEKIKRANELKLANVELGIQIKEKHKRAEELIIANFELNVQLNKQTKQESKINELQISSDLLKLSSQYSRSLIEAIRDPIFAISLYGKITDVNYASINVTEVSRPHLIGSEFCSYYKDLKAAKKCLRDIFEVGFVVDFPLEIKDGKLIPVLVNGSVYKDENGNIIGAVIIARDVSERRVFEKDLTAARDFAEMASLVAEDAQRNAELATVIAENAVKAKQQFLSNMSHEIRTPMNAIIGFTKVVLKTDLTDKQKEYLSAIKVSGDAMVVLINDILDLAKVDAGKMLFEKIPFKLKASVSSMLHLFEPKIQEKNLLLIKSYDENIPSVLMGDPVRLHQIILNLVSNAVKFTTLGKISVSVRLMKEDKHQVNIEFSVKDTGIGIKKDKIDTVFGSFQQATSGTSRIYGGTGLGLSIVKKLIESQGGSVSVESELEKGSTFTFNLPFNKTSLDVKDIAKESYSEYEALKIKVLVVEDIPLNQLLMKTLLDDFGFERDIASNGKIAIEKFKNNHYDIILMDLQMPEMNGFETTIYLREVMNSKVPIIALTADVTTVDLEKCKAVGMNDYISKPVDERLLYNKIISFVKKPSNYNPEDLISINNDKSCIDLSYLSKRTKSNPDLMMEMIGLYLEQTPPLIAVMKKSLDNKDWKLLHSAVHKIIPSFSIMGINNDFEKMAIKVKDFAISQVQTDDISKMIIELENICNQACVELKLEVEKIKKLKK
ncbi:MAG: ATP-binding protein [Bacteroidota bacterium]|nr:ATP-binding protein [Bacteroidota bacterium]